MPYVALFPEPYASLGWNLDKARLDCPSNSICSPAEWGVFHCMDKMDAACVSRGGRGWSAFRIPTTVDAWTACQEPAAPRSVTTARSNLCGLTFLLAVVATSPQRTRAARWIGRPHPAHAAAELDHRLPVLSKTTTRAAPAPPGVPFGPASVIVRLAKSWMAM